MPREDGALLFCTSHAAYLSAKQSVVIYHTEEGIQESADLWLFPNSIRITMTCPLDKPEVPLPLGQGRALGCF